MENVVGVPTVFKTRIYDSITLAPRLARKPKLFLYWLISARWPQLVLLLMVLILPKFIPSIVDTQLEKLYPPITKKKYLGIIKDTRPNPLLESRRKIARAVLWTGSGSLAVFLLMLHIPSAINNASTMARTRESKADAIADSRPSASVMLYNSALSLASDPPHETSIINKIKSIDQRISGGTDSKNAETKTSEVGPEGADTIKFESGTQTPVFWQKSGLRKVSPDMETDDDGYNKRYAIRHELGRGAMGIVYRAHDRILGRDVALKQIPNDLRRDMDVIVRFQQEAKALARLSHPHIVQVYDFVQDGHQAWIAMELVEGTNLDIYLKEKGLLSINETVQMGIQLAEALAYAHERGVVHRDFKPANVILAKNGTVKITDFGLAKIAQSSSHTQIGSILGSPAYMSPEQAQGKSVTSKSDVYALGITLYEMLSGQLPFSGELESVITQKLTKNPMPLPDLDNKIPEQIKRLIFQMLEKESNKRPESMDVIADVLRSI